jgi:fucose permease
MFGFASIAAGMALLASGRYQAAVAAFALIGAGYGAVVSAINLIFGTEYPERRGSLLTAVNLCWGAGAVLAAGSVALAERLGALRILLLALALCAVVLVAAFAPFLRRCGPTTSERENVDPERGPHLSIATFALFSLVLFLYVGAETAVAGWVATYMHRLGGLSVERASLLVSVFWLSVVVGRGLVVLLLRVFAERVALLGGLVMAMAGVATLLSPHSVGVALVAVVVAGLGFAPLFPLLVAGMLARTGRSRHAGWIFAICGSGGAVVPWIMGVVSQYGGGLRAAFLVPLAALAGILACVFIEAGMPRPSAEFVQ